MNRILAFLLCSATMLSASAVTLTVRVPDGSPGCYVSGAFQNWDASNALEMTPAADGGYTLELPDVDDGALAGGYKYLCGRAWKYVEKGASGEEISNRTACANPDRVLSWAAVYDPSIREKEMVINGYTRKVRICLPADYETSGKTYPVVYLTGVQQRYDNAGNDDAGDDFFAADSWNAAAAAHALGESEPIIVGVYGFMAEHIPFPDAVYAGSGAAGEYIGELIDVLIPAIENEYRVKSDAENRSIAGAGFGALLSVYAALAHPDVFGAAAALSPSLWTNADMLNAEASQADGNTRFFLSYGDNEEPYIGRQTDTLAAALRETGARVYLTRFAGGRHNDDSWREEFPIAARVLTDSAFQPSAEVAIEPVRMAARRANDSNPLYRFFTSTDDAASLQPDETEFEEIVFTSKGGTTTSLPGLVRVIDKDFKSTFYYNAGKFDGAEYTLLASSAKSVKFSSKKTVDSWLRVIVKDGANIEGSAYASTGFCVYKGSDKVATMAVGEDFAVTATVDFTDDVKSFTIHGGSVNSLSDMGALTPEISLSDNCTQAVILYDFLTNQVSVTETRWGGAIGDIEIREFSAVPAVTTPGATPEICFDYDENSHCTATLTVSHNYGAPQALPMSRGTDGKWHARADALAEGIHHFEIAFHNGTTSKENAARIAVKVLPLKGHENNKVLTVNAYEGIDWNNIGRYKANLHTHTSQSFDTEFRTDEVVDLYHNNGYSILALTDHDYNPYPWQLFGLFNSASRDRDPESLGMLAIPGVELSKDNRNTWDESTGGSFNHHNDFFTGRHGQEFASLRESYAYTQSIGGLQLINHPGQYWNLDVNYTPGAKNSPEWHAENFLMFPSLFGLEVYNQGNRRPNDRILWDQILDMTMPERPVWGYSNDDTHTRVQYFRNYQYILMPELSTDELKEALVGGRNFFSYEYTGSGEAKCPKINSVNVDSEACTIVLDTDATEIYWISGTDIQPGAAPATRRSTVVGMGKSFDFSGFKGSYVRALLKNDYGETCTQPFGFTEAGQSTVVNLPAAESPTGATEYYLINGIRVSRPAGGLIIRRQGDRAEKVLIK